MKPHALFYRMLTALTLLGLILPLSPSSSLLAQREPPPTPTTILPRWAEFDGPTPGGQANVSSSLNARVAPAADTSAPAPVTNLVASTGASPGAVELSWIAPGDDATAGTASTYIVRYNTTTITESNWATSTDATGEPTPSPAGSVESTTVSGLTPGRTYYFVIKTQDEVPNTSGISNSPAAVAQIGPNTVYLPLVVSSASSVPTVIPDTTEVLTETTTQYLSEISGDVAVFTFTQSTPALDALAPGEVIVGDATANAPYGFLRQVTSISSAGGQVVVETEATTLEEAIESGSAQVSHALTPDQVQASTQLMGVRLATAADLQDDFYLKLEDVVLYDHDGNLDTKHDQILANGSIRLKPDFDFSLRVQHFELQELSFIASAEETAKLEIEAKAALPVIDEKVEIARYIFSPITVMVGAVPVVLVPVLTINVGINGSVYVGLRSEVTQQATLRAGLRYAGEAWTPVMDFSNQFNYSDPPTLQPTAGVEAKGYAGAQIALQLYGLAGPYAEIDAYLKLDVDAAESPWWTLYGGLEVPVGVRMEVLGRELADYDIVAIGYRLALAHAQANNPPNLPFAPYPVDGATDQSVNVNPSWSGDDPDGDAVTYDVYFEAGDDTPDILVSDDQSSLAYDPGTLSPNTPYYWRIVVQDEQGATNAGPVWDFTTGTGTTCLINLTLQSPQVSDLTATISGTVSSSCSTITRLNWQWGDEQDDDQWFPASHTYAVSGTYPITVTAYNDLGDTEVANTTAYVGTASGEMVPIPAGEFQMGCDDTNPNEYCYSDEQPLHTVYLDAYTIDKYEVTNDQYAEFLNAEGNQEEGGDTWLDADDPDVHIQESGVWQADAGYEDHPVIEVTWYGARAYCTWAGKRLPTEAEWEKAARGSSDTRTYPWGDETPDCSRLNYYDPTEGYCVGDTTPVGSYPTGASPYGALDMAGNVWEWVNDWYLGDYYSTYPTDGWPSNPTGPASATYKVLRGGSFHNYWYNVRAANRYYLIPPTYGYNYLGFRCVGVAPGQ